MGSASEGQYGMSMARHLNASEIDMVTHAAAPAAKIPAGYYRRPASRAVHGQPGPNHSNLAPGHPSVPEAVPLAGNKLIGSMAPHGPDGILRQCHFSLVLSCRPCMLQILRCAVHVIAYRLPSRISRVNWPSVALGSLPRVSIELLNLFDMICGHL